jgi:hypothetical protein
MNTKGKGIEGRARKFFDPKGFCSPDSPLISDVVRFARREGRSILPR